MAYGSRCESGGRWRGQGGAGGQDLERRLSEIDAGEESIAKALERIDEQKEAAILQTLRRVNEHFQDVFAEMVPGGAGKLQVLRDGEGDGGGALTGVRIEVSFTGQAQSFLAMSQLSGGQKTVVAHGDVRRGARQGTGQLWGRSASSRHAGRLGMSGGPA